MGDEVPVACDVAIVGGGPSGLSAAAELRRLGVGSVHVIEREAEAGGIPRHCGHYGFGMCELNRVLRGPDYARRLVQRAMDAGASILTRSTVTALRPGPVLSLATPHGARELRARHVLLATGVREKSRAARLIGGTKPAGVVSTGALQGLVYLNKLRPFLRPVVLGSELVSFSALLTCRHMGIMPAAMIEPGSRVTAWMGSSLFARALGVPVMLNTQLTGIFGTRQVEAVELLDDDGQLRTIATDGVIVSGQFQPEAALLRASHLAVDAMSGGPVVDNCMRLSDPCYFAAGNLLRPVETAGWCWQEGRMAARMIEMGLAGKLPSADPCLLVRVKGDALKFVVPQRLILENVDGAQSYLQVRVTRPVRGRIAIELGGRRVWSDGIRALPERRLLLPLSWMERGMSGEAEISISEEAT